jgi:hypothetical protein
LPANEDYAKAILSIFSAKHIRPGQALRAEQVSGEFLAGGMGRTAEYEDALKYAIGQDWLRAQLNMIRLTDAGFAQM